MPDILRGEQRSGNPPPIGKAALIASAGGQRGYADWTNPNHRLRRLLSEFIGMAGLTFILSGGAAVLAKYGGHSLEVWEKALVLSVISGLWLVVAIYFLGDISAHFNPVATLAFALRRDMELGMVIAYWIVQFVAAAGGSLLARAFFGPEGKLAATLPQPGQDWQAVGFEAVITFGLILMVVEPGRRAQAQRAVRAAGGRRLRHRLGDHGRAVRGRRDEPGPRVRARRCPRKPQHLVDLPARAGDRGGRRCRRRVRAARPGQRRGGHRRRGNAAAPGHREPGNAGACVADAPAP